ncbi:MAG: 3-phosphoglycerate dehydrogenase family protein [Evtepia sp.]
MTYRIKTMNKISKVGLSQLTPTRFEIGDTVEHEDAILVRSAALHDYAFPEELRAIARAGAGVNNIPLDRCSEAGIVVFNTPGANANAVKELVIASLLISSRNIMGGAEWVREQAKSGATITEVVEKGKSAFIGPEITGKVLGVIGLGAIGVLVANAAAAMGMTVLGYDPFLSVPAALSLSPNVKHVQELGLLYREADYITLHLPMTSSTRGIINAAALKQMKASVRVLNLARGELVNTKDMIEALDRGHVAYYVTDFPDNEVAVHKNVIPIPHLGASTPESEDNCAIMAARQLQDYLDNGNIVNSVNLPNISQEWTTKTRICVIHRNIPDMLASFTSRLAKDGVNVEAMSNKAKGDFAYTILDVNSPMTAAVTEDLLSITGVLRVRILDR